MFQLLRMFQVTNFVSREIVSIGRGLRSVDVVKLILQS